MEALPNEIFYQIVNDLQALDFRAIACASKTLYFKVYTEPTRGLIERFETWYRYTEEIVTQYNEYQLKKTPIKVYMDNLNYHGSLDFIEYIDKHYTREFLQSRVQKYFNPKVLDRLDKYSLIVTLMVRDTEQDIDDDNLYSDSVTIPYEMHHLQHLPRNQREEFYEIWWDQKHVHRSKTLPKSSNYS